MTTFLSAADCLDWAQSLSPWCTKLATRKDGLKGGAPEAAEQP
jgi:hypothetical protein